VTIEAKDRLLKTADVHSLSVLVRVGGEQSWLKAGRFAPSDGPEGLSIDLDPAQEDLRIEPGSWLAAKVSFEAAGIAHVVTTPTIHYQPWFNRNEGVIIPVGTAALVLAAIFAITGVIYVSNPRAILWLRSSSDAAVETLKDVLPGFLVPIVRLLVFDKWLGFLASRRRVVSAWLSAYAAGRCQFADLDNATVELFSSHGVFLDCWVVQQLKGYRPYFEVQLASLKAAQYVPVPVMATTPSSDRQLIVAPSALSIRELIEDVPMALGVVGHGGTGKTTLLGRIGIWAMEANQNRRLLASGAAIPILIRTTTIDILDHVTLELKKGSPASEENLFNPALITAALRARRLIILVDGLSELDGETVAKVCNVFGRLPVMLLCFSARRAFREIAPAYREISPQELEGDDLNRFVSQYIFLNQLRDKWAPLEELLISQHLIELLQKRASRTSLPALFVKLILDTYDPQRDVASGHFPVNLGEAVQRFVRNVKLPADARVVDTEQLVQAATDIAVLCPGTELTPRAVDGTLVRDTLSATYGDNANRLLKELVDGSILISDVDAGGLSVNFSFDPVAEYLAAATSVKHFGADVGDWRQHLGRTLASVSATRNASGYLEALLECIVWIEGNGSIPEVIECELRRALNVKRASEPRREASIENVRLQ